MREKCAERGLSPIELEGIH
jgi:hypothetical protein